MTLTSLYIVGSFHSSPPILFPFLVMGMNMKGIPTQTLGGMRMSTNWIKRDINKVCTCTFACPNKEISNGDSFGKLQLLHGLVGDESGALMCTTSH